MALRESSVRRWQQIIKDHQASQQTAAEFCRRRDISSKQFYKWRQELKYKTTERTDHFFEVEFKETSPDVDETLEDFTGIHLHIGDAFRIELDQGFDISEFKKAAKALLSLSC
jgi:hypothetical protein